MSNQTTSSTTTTNRSFATNGRQQRQSPQQPTVLARYIEQPLEVCQLESLALIPAEARYEMDLYRKVGYSVFQPSECFYIGDPNLLASPMVYAGMSRFTQPRMWPDMPEDLRQSRQASIDSNRDAQIWAKATGSHLAKRGYALAVTSLRDCDAIVAGSALAAGGSVIVFLDNALEAYKETIQANQSLIQEGRLLFVSFTREVTRDRSGNVAWDRQNARNRNAVVAAMSQAVVIIDATSLDSSVMDVALTTKSGGGLVVVRQSEAIGNQHLVSEGISPVTKLDFPNLKPQDALVTVVVEEVEEEVLPAELSSEQPF